MGTLSGLSHLATGALLSDQIALDATATNIGNQNTVGYERRAVVFTEGDRVSVGSTGAGTGVTATVHAQRDRVLQLAVQQAIAASAASTSRTSSLDQLQTIFQIDSSGQDAAGLGSAVSSFFSAAGSVAASPARDSARQQMYAAAAGLVTTFHRAASQIVAISSSLDQQVTTAVTEVNGLTAQFASINGELAKSSSQQGTDTLLNRRDNVLTEIAKRIDVSSVSNADGTVNLTASDGTPLVQGSVAMALRTTVVAGTTRIVSSSDSGGRDVTTAIHGGSIGGALQARDQDIPALEARTNDLVYGLLDQVNRQNTAGFDGRGNPGGNLFLSGSAPGGQLAAITLNATDASGIAASSTSAANDGLNAAAVAALQTKPLVDGTTFAAALGGTLTALGQTAADARSASSAASAVLVQTTATRDAVTGVSLDQEAADLTQYQRSYQAAAKVLAIVNELMAQAINLGTPTTVA